MKSSEPGSPSSTELASQESMKLGIHQLLVMILDIFSGIQSSDGARCCSFLPLISSRRHLTTAIPAIVARPAF